VLLSLQSRRVGDITVVTCRGRIVEGAESTALHQHLDGLLPHHPYIVLNLGDVQFIDSSGLGLLVRFLIRAQAARGNLKLCAVHDHVAEVLKITRLKTMFESHESEADAVAAFYQRATSAGESFRFKTDILCVDKSADVLAYVREVLRQAGYGVLTADNLPDALTLLQATGAKLVVIGTELRVTRGTQTAERFNRLADAQSVVELPADFSSRDAGEAGQQLLEQVRAVMPASDTSVTAGQ
jgi:anti-sigma B factor antagonist